MTSSDVADTLAMALRSSGLERVAVRHRPRLLSDNGPSYVSAQLGSWLSEHGKTHTRGKPLSSDDPRPDQALPPLIEQPDPAGEPLRAGPTGSAPGRDSSSTPAVSSVCSHNCNSEGPHSPLKPLPTCPEGYDDIQLSYCLTPPQYAPVNAYDDLRRRSR
jgi:hypothetical protein